MTHGDLAWVAWAVVDARRRARRFAAHDHSTEADRARQELAEVEAWEKRRRGRAVRLWVAYVEVRVAALDAADAHVRLAGYLRHPYHRIGDTPGLYVLGGPEPAADVSEQDWERLRRDYPATALSHRGDREPYGPFERAHVAAYADALSRCHHALACGKRPHDPQATSVRRVDNASPTTGRARLLAPPGERVEPALAARGPFPGEDALACWRSVHRVHFLSHPVEAAARGRARELAATIVDGSGAPLGRIVRLEPEDGHPGEGGHWVHPAEAVGPLAAGALWDDYDAAEHDTGAPAALAGVLGRAAAQVRDTFARDARLHAAPEPPPGAWLSAAERAAEEARREAAGRSPDEVRRLADDADYLADRLDGTGTGDDRDRAEQLRRKAAAYREAAQG
ncbi:hypothetical protein [Prauserella muralis]|uniref:Uncharacterized protein n=1 Tax=Prauserella muralis TaxID=588067 RepID=A0A2V4AIM9_9PSEU|nr:hypothetical protein [Prauserella muralis]PXY19430.1 hypothetical protein BAY60_32330 [Prauserella muralis]TWE29405.1 hypothetical protein FHX69_2090 [Prauserella muralis]